MNPAAALLAHIVLAERADSRAQWMDHRQWSRARNVSGYHQTV